MGDHFVEIVHLLRGYLPQTIGQDPAASFRILSDLPRGIIPRLVEAGPRAGSSQEHGEPGSTYTIIYSRDLLDDQSLIVLLLAALSLPFFSSSFLNWHFNVPSILLLRARFFFFSFFYRSLFYHAFSLIFFASGI